MPLETEPLDNADDSAAYRWGIRLLYATALGIDIYLYWRMVQDDTDLAVLKSKVRTALRRAVRPITEQREWRKAVGRMHWQALEAVEEGATHDG